jgi:hypothetical protein
MEELNLKTEELIKNSDLVQLKLNEKSNQFE